MEKERKETDSETEWKQTGGANGKKNVRKRTKRMSAIEMDLEGTESSSDFDSTQ